MVSLPIRPQVMHHRHHQHRRLSQKAAKQLPRKMSLACSVEDKIDGLWVDGFVVMHTDGSAEIHAIVGSIAGYGVYSECGISISAPLPADFHQTIHTAERYGATQALRSTSAARVAICLSRCNRPSLPVESQGLVEFDPIDLLLKGMHGLKCTLCVSETYHTTEVKTAQRSLRIG